MSIVRSIQSATAVAALIALAAPGVVESAGKTANRSMETEIQICVSEVGKNANYEHATRVVHMIMAAKQKNLAEQQFTIDTMVFTDNKDAIAREYRTRCVTRGALKLVDFEISQTDQAQSRPDRTSIPAIGT